MPDIRDKIKTIVLLMFENRSFNHMLGHLSLEGINPNVDGLKRPLSQYENLYQGDVYNPFPFTTDGPLPFDLPHEYNEVAVQLAMSPVSKKYMMTGFVESYAGLTKTTPNPQCEPMAYFPSSIVKISSFLARTYCTCERWFNSLPTSTQPNRTMAFFGDTPIFESGFLIPASNSIFDWLDRANARWRVYHDSLPFFSLYPSQWGHVLGPKFRDYESFAFDWMREDPTTAPQVIVVEPSYQDGPHVGSDHPNDNHAPLAIGWGEEFLRRTYDALLANPKRLEETVFIVYYDEHGGFWDHVAPPPIGYTTIGDQPHVFESLGPRIPGIVVSPWVDENSVCNLLLDHTSVLQLLAEMITPGSPYNATVEARRTRGIQSISQVLTRATPRKDLPPAPADPIPVSTELGKSMTAPKSQMTLAFEAAANQMIADRPADVQTKFPELLQWKASMDAAKQGSNP